MESRSKITIIVISMIIGLALGGGIGYSVGNMNKTTRTTSDASQMSMGM